MSQNSFLKGAAVLGIAGMIVKVIGIFFRIPLTNWIGESGMSYYGSVYPIYTLFLIISTAGIPVAISRMVSERIAVKNYGGAHKVFQTSIWLMGAIGLVSFSIVYFNSEFISEKILHNAPASLSLEAIAPSLLLVPIMSAYRGYFQGRQNMNPTAVSQLFEQLFRVVFGLGLAYFLLDSGYEVVCAGATFGSTAGAGAGLFVVILIYIFSLKHIKQQIRRNKSHISRESTWDIIKKILIIAVPITIGASILPLMGAIDSAMVMGRLQATGWTVAESKALFGRLTSYCNPLIGMPQVFVQAVVMSLVPAISAAYIVRNKKEVEENVQFSMRTTMIIAFPCAVGMFSLAEPILKLLYSAPSRAAEVEAAVPSLRILCLSIIFMSTLQNLTGILQGVDRQMLPVKNLAIGSIFKLVLTYICVGIPFFNVNGASIGTIAAYLVATLLNMKDIKKLLGITVDYSKVFIKPFIASALMGVSAFASYKLLFMVLKRNSISTILAIMIAVVVYVLLIFITKAITKEEVLRLPKGDKIVRVMNRFIK